MVKRLLSIIRMVFSKDLLSMQISRWQLRVHFPEGNFLVEKGIYESFVEMPDYVTDVKMEKADHFNANKDRQYLEKSVPELEDNPN